MMRRFSAFNIDTTKCPPNEVKSVKTNANVFLAFLIIFLVSTPLLIYSLVAGAETTLVIRNDQTLPLTGFRVGTILEKEAYPEDPFPFEYDSDTDIMTYAGKENITQIALSVMGFFIMNREGLDYFYANRSRIMGLFGSIAMGAWNGMLINAMPLQPKFDQQMAIFGNFEHLANNTIIAYMGNIPTSDIFPFTQNHDLRLKMSAGLCMIPLISISIHVKNTTISYDETETFIGMWSETLLNNTKDATLTSGFWDIRVGEVHYNYESAFAFVEGDVGKISTDANMTTPITVDLEIKRSFDLTNLLIPVTEYSLS